MATRPAGKVEFYTDFSALAKFVGAGYALCASEADEVYLGDLVQGAFGEIEEEFNAEAAAFAAAGGRIKHMFEWGTAGINRGRTNMRPNPLSERARLWGTKLSGHGFSQTYSYYFKPSVAFVPKPTATETGMSPEVIQKLKNHIFWNKAMVFETGMLVTIKPVEAKWLLMPAYSSMDTTNWRPADRKRGYMLSKGPNVVNPGANTAGNFTAYWTDFWNGRGEEMVDTKIDTYFEQDFLSAMQVNVSEPVKPAMTEDIIGAVKKEQRRVTKNARARARYRAKKEGVL